jgi:hypothetical protein
MTNLLKILLVAIATLALVSSHEMGEVDITSAKFVDYETSRDIENVPGFEPNDVAENKAEHGFLRSNFNTTAAHSMNAESSYQWPGFAQHGFCRRHESTCILYCSNRFYKTEYWFYLNEVRRSCIEHNVIHPCVFM